MTILEEQKQGYSGADWPEDLKHENGNYMNACMFCKCHFQGHKRRVVCKACTQKMASEKQ